MCIASQVSASVSSVFVVVVVVVVCLFVYRRS